MSDLNESPLIEDRSLVDRRAFLKKAGLAVGAAAALYVAPSVLTVKAAPAYSVVTSAPPPIITVRTYSPECGETLYGEFEDGQVTLAWQSISGAQSYKINLEEYENGSDESCPPSFSRTLTVNEAANGESHSANVELVFDDEEYCHMVWKVEGFSAINAGGSLLGETNCCAFTYHWKIEED